MLDKDVMEPIMPSEARQKMKDGYKFTRTFMFYKDKYIEGVFDKLKDPFVNMVTLNQPDDKSNSTSPNVMAESVNVILVEAVQKGRKLAVKDVKGAYLNASTGISKKYIIIQKGIADTLCKLKPEWEKFRDDGGRLYCLKKKALYGSKDASELWYKDMSGTLKGLGFVANPYDPCVFNLPNKNTGDNLITIGLHVDDLLVSAVDEKLLDWLHNKLVDKYGEVTYNKSNKLRYLGINITIKDNNTIELDCEDSFEEMMRECHIDKKATTPAGKNLFLVSRKGEELSQEKKREFLSRIMKIQYYAKKVRMDLLTTLAYLRTRVTTATTDDWKKLQ